MKTEIRGITAGSVGHLELAADSLTWVAMRGPGTDWLKVNKKNTH